MPRVGATKGQGMSECTLYALDAPRIETPEGAARHIEKAVDNGSASPATARLKSFFEALLVTFPDDDSEASVWYEGFAHNPPAGSVIELVFWLERIDAAQLRNCLRDLAGRHQLHIFDPEGHVLYLSDGREAANLARPPVFPLPGAVSLFLGPAIRRRVRTTDVGRMQLSLFQTGRAGADAEHHGPSPGQACDATDV